LADLWIFLDFFAEKIQGKVRGFFVVLWAVFEGCFRKSGGSRWCFCGEVVVKRVVNVVKKSRLRGV
jgi:hypothetical protein